MYFMFGAALMIAAIAVLHAGRRMVERVAAVNPRRETLVTDLLAIAFTALFGPGLVMFVFELLDGTDAGQLLLLAASVVGVVVGSKLLAAAARRRAAPVVPAIARETAPQ